jgi:endonuclease G
VRSGGDQQGASEIWEMSARAKRGAGRARKIKAVFWLNVILLTVMGGWFVMQPPARRSEVAKLVENYFEKNKRIELLDVARDIYRLYYSADFVRAVAPGDRTHVYGGAPQVVDTTRAVRLLTNTGYVTGYLETFENPGWVAYRVRDLDRWAPASPRPENFEIDSRTAARVPPSAYTNSGYDRGHLAPNYAIATRYGEKAQRETFLMSNIVPQRHALNAGLWKEMEMKIATSYPGRFEEVWVFAGPVFGARPARLPNGTAVPEAFFMMVIDESDGRIRVQALLFPQETSAGADLALFLTSVDEVERRTGYDFFTEIDDSAEATLEAKRAESAW